MTAWIGLGANLGDRRATLQAAFEALERLPAIRIGARSSLWSSPPLLADGPDYLNAVARLHTTLEPHELLAALQSLEASFGRERPYPNAPRTLDLDLLLHDEITLNTATLTLPHPRMHLRAFVLRPLAEIDPDLSIPGVGPVRQCLIDVADQCCSPAD
jgi:2-amino-4-hydroxy-6-hydroxymethyldihydropteridine diphosphokinase